MIDRHQGRGHFLLLVWAVKMWINLLRNKNVNDIVMLNVKGDFSMSERVVQFTPYPRDVRPVPDPLGLYVRVGHTDYSELLNLIAAGDAQLSDSLGNSIEINPIQKVPIIWLLA